MPPIRHDILGRLQHEMFDVLIIGGGATGAGAALDAATRGLKTALVDRVDFGAATSSRSTKLIHGGVRYLEQAVRRLDRGQFALVRDALRERSILLRIAPHLTRRLPIVTPLYQWRQVPYMLTGLKLYDWIAGRARLGRSSYLSPATARQRFPMLRRTGLRGAVLYYDGQFDDARMNTLLALTAIEHGAAAANHVGIVGFQHERNRIIAAEAEDRLTGDRFTVRAKTFINATGPFTDSIRQLDDPHAPTIMAVSSGIHVILDQRFAPPDTGLLIPKTEDGRVLFLLPWLGHTLVGTTDNPASPAAHPRVSEGDIEYLLRHVRQYFDLPVTRDDVKAAWSGLRPLVSDSGAGSTAKLSRDHVILTSPSGLITITGGKWTTYRHMAEEVIDEAIARGGLAPTNPCRSASVRILGAEGYDEAQYLALMDRFDFDRATARHLSRAYGDRAAIVAGITRDEGAGTLAPGHPHLEAEVIYAIEQEMACTAMDVLARRTRLAFVDAEATRQALPRVLALLASRLGWDRQRIDAERNEVEQRLEQGL